ncbi:MAG TPA: HigA family addiction module antitoxin [Gemmatimonadaceae bacterium]|nr:HigA family addiction module antitoxin [Gemmatimonadaceae bacterium]HRQ78413.1 HigA family addiction module antitoxin [Gemmatimonadaceae bacterium]
MSIPNTKPLERRPIHPGEILREDFLPEYELSVTALAEALGVSRQSVNELLRERRAVSPEIAHIHPLQVA